MGHNMHIRTLAVAIDYLAILAMISAQATDPGMHFGSRTIVLYKTHLNSLSSITRTQQCKVTAINIPESYILIIGDIILA